MKDSYATLVFGHLFLLVSGDHGSKLRSISRCRLVCVEPQQDRLHHRRLPRSGFGRILFQCSDRGGPALAFPLAVRFVIAKLPNLLSFLPFFGFQTSILISRAREQRKPSFRVQGRGPEAPEVANAKRRNGSLASHLLKWLWVDLEQRGCFFGIQDG